MNRRADDTSDDRLKGSDAGDWDAVFDEDSTRSAVGRAADADPDEWEVFRRGAITEPVKHVGSVTAPTVATAREQAATLFGDAAGLWLCPADAVARFETATLDGDGR